MQVLNLTVNEDGSISQFQPDFKIMRGSYRNILLNLRVPHSLLLDPVQDTEDGSNQTGNNVRISAVIRTATGQNLLTKKRYEFKRVKDYQKDGQWYRLYQRRMPKEFTMWETVNLLEAINSGVVEMITNVVNWTKTATGRKIEEVAASPVFKIDVYPSAFLDNAEEIEEPSNFDELHSQVQDMDAELKEIHSDLYGTPENNLGDYLVNRLKAGNKITIEQDSTQAPNNKLKISVQTTGADEVPIESITGISATDVQGALENLQSNIQDTNQSLDAQIMVVNNEIDKKVSKTVMKNAETANGIVTHIDNYGATDSGIDEMSLHITKRSIVDGSKIGGLTSIPFKLASETSRGLMSKENVLKLDEMSKKVAALEGKASRYMYSEKKNPTANDIDNFVKKQGQVIPYTGVAVVVADTYHVWHYYENNIGWRDDGSDTVNQATNNSAGIVIGSNEKGKIYIENDGTMSVVGFDAFEGEVVSLKDAYTEFVTAEALRVESETSRITAENTRNSKEAERISAEDDRVSSEADRKVSETSRITAENTRNSKEAERISAETGRVESEKERVTSESKRVEAEKLRDVAENTRSKAEEERASAESVRVSSHNQRLQEVNQVKIDYENATKDDMANNLRQSLDVGGSIINNEGIVATPKSLLFKHGYCLGTIMNFPNFMGSMQRFEWNSSWNLDVNNGNTVAHVILTATPCLDSLYEQPTWKATCVGICRFSSQTNDWDDGIWGSWKYENTAIKDNYELVDSTPNDKDDLISTLDYTQLYQSGSTITVPYKCLGENTNKLMCFVVNGSHNPIWVDVGTSHNQELEQAVELPNWGSPTSVSLKIFWVDPETGYRSNVLFYYLMVVPNANEITEPLIAVKQSSRVNFDHDKIDELGENTLLAPNLKFVVYNPQSQPTSFQYSTVDWGYELYDADEFVSINPETEMLLDGEMIGTARVLYWSGVLPKKPKLGQYLRARIGTNQQIFQLIDIPHLVEQTITVSNIPSDITSSFMFTFDGEIMADPQLMITPFPEKIKKTTRENITNKVTQLSAESTDEQYVSAKCVYDLIYNLQARVIELENKLV